MNDCRQGENGKNRLYGRGTISTPELHTAWLQFIRYCTELGYGEIDKLKIQDGLPMIAELAVKKIRFAP